MMASPDFDTYWPQLLQSSQWKWSVSSVKFTKETLTKPSFSSFLLFPKIGMQKCISWK